MLAADCRVVCRGGGVIEGHEQFLEVERQALEIAPRRRMRLEHEHVTGQTVVMEITLLNPDAGEGWELPFVTILTMRNGKIAVDTSFADWSRWAGFDL